MKKSIKKTQKVVESMLDDLTGRQVHHLLQKYGIPVSEIEQKLYFAALLRTCSADTIPTTTVNKQQQPAQTDKSSLELPPPAQASEDVSTRPRSLSMGEMDQRPLLSNSEADNSSNVYSHTRSSSFTTLPTYGDETPEMHPDPQFISLVCQNCQQNNGLTTSFLLPDKEYYCYHCNHLNTIDT
ncbi:hypothetical protein BLNAU_15028 [Blattamonas nauphoetae]|uniref:Lunapark zinc ribbon domain-containing protein n=1 Tax=Blattamonas nauphoetae TaxID=2049346 RepID=A0ABQ9XBW6_9EUKA|nr:hypothetical protein BLNAU_15028 [Blattamonas nauphoetae]